MICNSLAFSHGFSYFCMVEIWDIMTEETVADYIDFEEEKAKLWRLAYSEIKRLIIQKSWANQRIELPNNGVVKSVTLEFPGILILEDNYGNYDYAESFEDDTLFEVYYQLKH